MERKRIEKLVVLLLIGILIPVSLFPFSVYADSYVSPSYVDNTQRDKWQNAGGNVVNFSEDPLTGSTPSKLTFTFNDNYYGFVSFQPYSGSSVWNDSTVFIAGGVGYYNYRNSSSYNPKYIDGVKITYVNLFLPDSNVDLTQIIDILTAIEQDTTSLDTTTDSILTDLQSVLNQIISANGYLDILTRLRQYNLPIESWRANFTPLLSKQPKTFQNVQYWNYPVFDISSGLRVVSEWNYNTYTTVFIFGTSDNITEANVNDWFTFTTDGSYELTFSTPLTSRLGDYKFIRFDIKHTSHATVNISAKKLISNFIYIYIGNLADKNISTDFALQWGLSNRLLDNLDIIANGTTQSSSASGSLDQTTSQFSDDANDLVTIEESFNNSMNQSLQNVNPTFNMGSSFLTSANWVSQQFNRIVNNTPFASLITFGLTLGLGLLIVGKVRK